MRTITLEEHYATAEFMDGPGRRLKEAAAKIERLNTVAEKLCELGEKRIAEMDAAGIDVVQLGGSTPTAPTRIAP